MSQKKEVWGEKLTQYLAELNKAYKAGNATEHTYRPALKRLLESLFADLTVTNEPKHTDCGAPDYIVTRGEIPVGYMEAKDIDVDLQGKANKEQLDRYRKSLSNLIITDYLTFQLFKNGEHVLSVVIGKTTKNAIEANTAQFATFMDLLHSFTGYEGQGIKTSEHLSKVMAAKARLMANIIEAALDMGETDGDHSLDKQLKGFREVLIHDITHKDFADIYAQTIAYGMFAAKLNDETNDTFIRAKAAQLIPQSNPFLRKLFQYIAGYDLDGRIRWVVDDLADLFNHVDIDAINKEFGKSDHDPIIHFYETFLAEYDPALRKSRGVWYTPQPVVRFIVQAVDDILKQEFGLSQGLADTSIVKLKRRVKQKDGNVAEKGIKYHRVQIFDPAAGTGTFLTEVVRNIHKRFKNQQGMWKSYTSKHLIPRINGFEVLMASYVMAHLKLEMQLQKTGFKLTENKRFHIYLTNSLEEAHAKTDIPFAQWLSDEANEASHIKQDVPVMVVLGNPPYSGESQNSGEWIERLMLDYKKEPSGIKLQERNSKWINDDYVKFIRYGQYFVEKNGEGVLAYINNHSFLDNPTFRGMRWRLLQTFDTIYILDLHGNAKKKETAPDGGKDENVFDIQQGVSINIFVKTGRKKTDKLAEVFRCDLYGKRGEKYSFLSNNSLQTIKWNDLKLTAPHYFFVAKNFSRQAKYDKGFSVQELFPVNSVGVVTARDAVFVNDNRDDLIKNIRAHFNIVPDETLIHEISYRPFDKQYIYYDIKKIERARKNIMRHFLKGENIGLVTNKPAQGGSDYFSTIYLTNNITDQSIFTAMKNSPFICPLYLYPESDKLFADEKRRPNLKKEIVDEIAKRTNLRFTEEVETHGRAFLHPIDILDYVYAVLHSPSYRERYKEFLKIDFPRVPYPQDVAQFRALAALGAKLRRLHLMENVAPLSTVATYPKKGDNNVEKLSYENNRVWINDVQYFDHVPPEAWDFYIGGYQPAQKWLKDRKGRTLGYEDIQHYQKIIRVLRDTGKVMQEVDEVMGK
jgi:predicted helicase